jgi:conjugal transfer ATP-binding protein TraC
MTSGVLADYLEIWGFEDNFVIFADGSIGFGLNARPIDIACWEDDRINSFATRVGQFVNGLPEEIDLQFVQEIDSGNDSTLEHHADLSPSADAIAKALCEERVNRLRLLDQDGRLPVHRLRIFVRRPCHEPVLGKPKLFSKRKEFERISDERVQSELNRTSQLRNSLIQGLQQLGIESEAIDADQFLDLIYRQWNPERSHSRPKYDPSDVRSSLLFTDLSLSEKGFSLANRYYRVLSLKLLPDSTCAAMAACLRQLPFGSKLFLSIHVPHQQKELERLKTQRRIAFSMARGKTESASDLESESKYESLESLLEEMISQGEKVFKVAMNVVLSATTEAELEIQTSEALMKLRELGGAEAMEETIAAFDIFSRVALPNARAKERLKYLKTSNLSDLIPLYGPWPGHPLPRILLRSRMGSLVPFDPFASALTNYNQIVSGGSGAGKSFLTNILLLHMLKESPRIFVVDIGGSYKKMCEHLGGQYIPLGLDANLQLNPFDLSPNETIPSNEKIKFLLGLVELMTKEEGDARLPKLERAEIEEAIQKTYSSEMPRLGALRELLLNHANVEIRRFGRILTPWCGETPYGKFLDAATNITLTKPIVVFDLKGMESYPDLQAAALFIITDFVWREVQQDKTRMKFLVFDECWRLLENEAGLSFIEVVFRTFRKYFASAVAISQNIDDFAKSRIAGAILSNSAVKWILMQKGADQKRLGEVLQLNENEMSLVASLVQERGRYSEAFLLSGDDRAVVAIESTPLEYWLATTDPRDLAAIREKEENGVLGQKAILQLSQRYPHGIAAGALNQ